MDRGTWRATVHGVAESDMAGETGHACTHTHTPLHKHPWDPNSDKE